MKVERLMTAAIAFLLILISSTGAYADSLSLRYSTDDATWLTTTKVTAPFDLTVSASAGIFNVVIETGQGSPGLPGGTIDLNSTVRTDAGGSGTLYVELSQDNITTPGGSWLLQFGPTF